MMQSCVRTSQAGVLLLCVMAYFSLGISRCDSYSQNPSDLFFDNQVPVVLEQLMNPPLSEEMLLSIRNKDPRDRMVVAVIDNGTDYQAIYQNIHFGFGEDGSVTDAGVDLLGNDSWAHPNTIDATLFAFGAESINDQGQIVNPQQHPLDYYNSHNKAFMDRLILAIKEDPILPHTLFSKITEHSMSLMGAVHWAEGKSDFQQTTYDELLTNGKLVNWQARKNKKLHENSNYWHHKYYAIVELPWLMGPDLGLPVFINMGEHSSKSNLIKKFEGAKEFYHLVRKVYTEYCLNSGFQQDLDTYIRFRELRPSSSGQDSIYDSRKTSAELIHNAWFRKHYGYIEADPLETFSVAFKSYISIKDWDFFRNPAATPEAKESQTYQILSQWFSQLELLYAKTQSGAWLSDTQKESLKKNTQNIALFKSKMYELLKQRGVAALYEDRKLLGTPASIDYRNYGRYVGNPFLEGSSDYLSSMSALGLFSSATPTSSSNLTRPIGEKISPSDPLFASTMATSSGLAGSQGVSHGTHTAGTIIGHSKERKVDVWPIRVTTSSLALSASKQQSLADNFLAGFEAWLHRPIVAYAVKARVKSHITTSNFEIDLAQDAAHLAVQVAVSDHMAKNVARTIKESSLDYDFFEQILTAIQLVAEKRILIASMSLGLLHKKDVPSVTGDLAKNEWKELIKFLKYEYFKFMVGETLKNDAPNTLFLVAAGNDGAWIDAHSRSALPAGLESPFLAEFEARFNTQVPNNHLKNLLAIGSLAQDHHFSSFTNILIYKDVIYGIGESVLSSIKLSDHLGTGQAYKLDHGKDLDRLSLPDDERVEAMVSALPWVSLPTDETAKAEALKNEISHVDFLLGELVTDLQWAHFRDYRLHSQKATGKMNGTSMATPQVAGILAESVRIRMISQNLQWQDLYGQPSFLPQDLIVSLFEMGSQLKTTPDSSSKILTQDSSEAWKEHKKTPLGELTNNEPEHIAMP